MLKRLLPLLALMLLLGCGKEMSAPTSEAPAAEATFAVPETTAADVETVPSPDTLGEILDNMTLEEKVGQMFLGRCRTESAAEDLKKYHLGGYILYGCDFEDQTPDSIRQTIESYQSVAGLPLLIAVDEEGGTVCRVSAYPEFRSEPFPSPRTLYAQGGRELALCAEAEKAYLLHSLGINVNMAPVCDVTTQPGAFLYSRSLGQSPEETGRFAAEALSRMAEYGVGGVMKHFPGYGSNADTHTGMAVSWRSLAQMEAEDLPPFQAGIDTGLGAVLVGHIMVMALDDHRPASLSGAVIGYLRQEMGFEGVIITDDLAMGAITDTYGAGEAAVLAVLAGNSMLCSTEYDVQYQAVLEAAVSGRIEQASIDDAVYRILLWKHQLGLLE